MKCWCCHVDVLRQQVATLNIHFKKPNKNSSGIQWGFVNFCNLKRLKCEFFTEVENG